MDAAFELRSSCQGLHPLPSYPSCSGEGSGVGYGIGVGKRVQVGRGGRLLGDDVHGGLTLPLPTHVV
jgi:hypothetical protein